ncbi:CRISPR-associated protein Cas4 [Halocella sp. SP3-1]|uniref:CRISPR-associated protein Cas4 n=1 Tax=Halocella sp. SP3-1 TaxID=2382161 RepID=UPI000F757A7A|nr:CRISPR-associated protein Cas4 [Halocella sp. SP3-1]AZO96387.1 CRISPR-associated protein Cas4 [Halocella sp. SP3-1]
MEENVISITPSEVMEYLYCPRFIYFMSYLKISQHEKNRFKVIMGREVHKTKANINKNYLRKKIGVKEKLLEQKLYSKKYKIHGIVDEVLFLEDGTAAPLDYKFAKYKERTFSTHKYQAIMYGMLIEDNYNIKVNKAFLIYVRSRNLLKEIPINKETYQNVKTIIEEIINIIDKGYFPKGTKYKRRCSDCTYRNICIR